MPRAVLCAVLATLVIAAPAGAQAPDDSIALEVRAASASLTARFASDAATCAAVGRCGLRGTVAFRSSGPALGGGFVSVADGAAVGGGGFYQRAGATTATVHDRGQTCRDRLPHRVTAFAARPSGPMVQFTFFAPAAAFGEDAEGAEDPLSTRCAGPRLADLGGAAGALPVATVSLASLRGAATVAATGRRSFVAEGLRVRIAYDVSMTVAALA